MVQVDILLVLVPLVPRRSEDPLRSLLVPLVPLRSEDHLLLVPLESRLQLVPTCSKIYSQSDVHQQNHFAVQFTGVFAPKASSMTNKTPYTKSLPPCFAVFAEFRLADVSARSPVNLPVLALALSASRRLLTVYSSSH